MRRVLIGFCFVLFSLYFLLSAFDSKGDYVAEKELWHLNKRFLKAAKHKDSIPDRTFEILEEDYKDYLIKFEGSRFVPLAHMFIGRLYIVQGENELARSRFEEVVEEYSQNKQIGAQAVSEIARSFYIEENRTGVLGSYNRIVKNYPLTDIGLKTPLLIAKYYAEIKDGPSAKKSFDDAIKHYKKLISLHPNSQLELQALQMISSCYLAQTRWIEGIEVFSDILMKFAGPLYLSHESTIGVVRMINTITISHSRDFDYPINIYTSFIKAYPDHPINSELKKIIISFEELKQREQK